MRVTDTQYIELFPDAVGDSAPPFANVGFNHLCLEVDDIDGAIAELTSKGVVLTAEKKLGVDHNYQAWIADPEGNRIELMQLGEEGPAVTGDRPHQGRRLIAMDLFKHLGHIALRVADLDASLAFYDKLGFREMTRLLNDKGEAWIVYLRINDDQYLELFPKGVDRPETGPNSIGIFTSA